MRWKDIGDLPCSVARTLSVIGDRWTMLIIRDCFLGTRRFEAFQNQLGISRHRLADRLEKLVTADILVKVPYQEKPQRYEYRLTEKGIDLYPILMALVQWGDKWQATTDGPPLEYIHRSCGHKTKPVFTCSVCQEPLTARQMKPVMGPGLQPYLEANDEETAQTIASYRLIKQEGDEAP